MTIRFENLVNLRPKYLLTVDAIFYQFFTYC